MRPLADIRADIDGIDAELSALLCRRLALAGEVAETKRRQGLPCSDGAREREILTRLSASVGQGDAADVRRLYRELFSISKSRQCQADDKNYICSELGKYLKLNIYGLSHSELVGMRLENFPKGFKVNLDDLKYFMGRRAPGRDALVTQRKETDVPEFVSGLKDGVTDGSAIEAVIRNCDARPDDYGLERSIPRPAQADYPQWCRYGRMFPGGGANSGRLTAPMCVAGHICQQWLKLEHGILFEAYLNSVGGKADGFDDVVRSAQIDGDSVGAEVTVSVPNLPAGLGGPMFDGLESELSSALFAIPGVKGVSFGNGFTAAALRGSQNNDAFEFDGIKIVTDANRHGGLLGGMTTGMPLEIHIAFKPTPSIAKEQRSIDLAAGREAVCTTKGRHDPCIALRALPVVEALVAFVLADAMLAERNRRPAVCLVLSGRTISADTAVAKRELPLVDMVELRVDCLEANEREVGRVKEFVSSMDMPTILTIRRKCDGGNWEGSEDERAKLFDKLLKTEVFKYVDFEDGFRCCDLVALAKDCGTRIIRSLHDFNGVPQENLVQLCRRLKGDSDEIPKIACQCNSPADATRIFMETFDFDEFPHIICGMGANGIVTRILAGRTHSMLSFVSPVETIANLRKLGHLTPLALVRDFRFKEISTSTKIVSRNSLEEAVAFNHTAALQGLDTVAVPVEC